MTTTNSQFQTKLNNVVDLIYAAYKTQTPRTFKKLGRDMVAIYYSDLEEYGFKPDQFIKLIKFLQTQNGNLQLISNYNEDALAHWDNVGDHTIPEPPVCTIKLSKNFTENYQSKFRVRRAAKNESIEKLTIIQPKQSSKYKIIINDDYANPITVDSVRKDGKTWRLLLALEKGGLFEEKEYKSSVTMLNSNKNSRLYSQTGYRLTKVLAVEHGYVKAAVKLNSITEKAFKHKFNQLKST